MRAHTIYYIILPSSRGIVNIYCINKNINIMCYERIVQVCVSGDSCLQFDGRANRKRGRVTARVQGEGDTR